MRVLYPFQEEAVNYHLTHHYSLNCSEMGLGKSLMALETARRAKLNVAVFGPAFLRGVWESEGAKSGVVFKYFPYSQMEKVSDRELNGLDFWIADECHYLKNPRALRTQIFYEVLKRKKPKYFIGLTGTPIKNRVPDFWTLIGFCGVNPQETSGRKLAGGLEFYNKFARYFCNVEIMAIGRKNIEKFVGIKSEKIPEFKDILKDKFIRFKVENVLKDLPEIIRKEVNLKLPFEIDGLEDMFIRYMAGSKADIKAKVSSATMKANATAEYCIDLIYGGSGPLVVFTDHIDSAMLLGDKIGGSRVITGQTPMNIRNDAVNDFQAGKINVIVATIGSLSVGVTLTAARHVVFNDLSWVPADNLQAEKRIHRIGQKSVCFAHYIDTTPTDSYIRRTLFGKLETINQLVG